ncbi:hypothetical protein WJX72_006352 [[Myrmecia] bisecta]|uniref:Denticleless n=1 Tax=[Myrmecia] bisecta TaxID=41462 RepID=A0AAW1QFK4_9CHLO
MHSNNLCRSLQARQFTGRKVLGRPFLADLSCEAAGAGTILVNPSGVGAPPFAAKFSKTLLDCKLLAIADEEGNISIVDAGSPLPPSLFEENEELRPEAQWLAHRNAVFDLTWAKDDKLILTASGDQSIGLWNTADATCLGSCRGHDGSVKSISVQPNCEDVFASGARDGALMLWDTRTTARRCPRTDQSCYAPVLKVQDAHSNKALRRQSRVGSKHSVTSVLFLHQSFVLATAGAADGIVKFWDVRKMVTPTAELAPSSSRDPTLNAFTTIDAGNSGGRPHGITCLAQDPHGSGLIVSVSNHTHYMYDGLRPELPASRMFQGHSSGSFYIKTAFSPDGTHIVSGSSDRNVHIWQVDRPYQHPYMLAGHTHEVTAVAWCPTDFGLLATCGDDFMVKLWTIDRPWPPRQAMPCPKLPHQEQAGPSLFPCPAMPAPAAYAPTTPGAVAPQTAMRAANQNVDPLAGPAPAPEWPGFASTRGGGQMRTPFTPHTNLQTPQDPTVASALKRKAVSAGAKTQRSIRDFFAPPPGPGSARPAKQQKRDVM